MKILNITIGDELQAAIEKHQRKRESVEALFLRMLTQRTRAQEVARQHEIKSLSHRIHFTATGLQRDQQRLLRLQQRLDELRASE